MFPKDVHRRLRGAEFHPTRQPAKELFPNEFPQPSTRLSNSNLGICIFCVNVSSQFYVPVLSNQDKSAENQGKSASMTFLGEKSQPSFPLLVANFPQMNFTQMHERLRLELLRRIQRGTLSVSLLARQSGFGQPHLSNFFHGRRQLSLEAIDRVLASQHLTAADLLPVLHRSGDSPADNENSSVPIVSHAAALFEPFIRLSAVHSLFRLPAGVLQSLHTRVSNPRRVWQRFVAVRIPSADALAMDPLVLPEAIVLIDRHYNSLAPNRPSRPNVYAVRHGSHLVLRYVELLSNRLVLRPHNLAFPVDVIQLEPGEASGEILAGRIALIANEL